MKVQRKKNKNTCIQTKKTAKTCTTIANCQKKDLRTLGDNLVFFKIWMQDTLTFSEPWPKEEAAHI